MKIFLGFIVLYVLNMSVCADYKLYPGWQLLGADKEININDFKDTCAEYIWAYNKNSNWMLKDFKNDIIVNGKKLNIIKKGYGYWLKANENGCIVNVKNNEELTDSILHTVYTYDEDILISTEKFEYSFINLNQIKRVVHTQISSDISTSDLITEFSHEAFDKNGNPTKITQKSYFENDAAFFGTYDYNITYDSNGRLIEEDYSEQIVYDYGYKTIFNGNGKVKLYYNGDHTAIQTIDYKGSSKDEFMQIVGKTIGKTILTYDNNNIILIESNGTETLNDDMTIISEIANITYSPNNLPISLNKTLTKNSEKYGVSTYNDNLKFVHNFDGNKALIDIIKNHPILQMQVQSLYKTHLY